MDAIECIKTRRSRRLFLDKKISIGTINKIIECAIAAPSSADCQPWQFVIVSDQKKKKELVELKDEENQQHIMTAPVSLVVCVDTEKSPSRYIEDGVTATQNIMLAAHALGLGSVYVTGSKLSEPEVAEGVRKILLLPKSILPVTIIPIGYADKSEILDQKSLLDINEIVHINKW